MDGTVPSLECQTKVSTMKKVIAIAAITLASIVSAMAVCETAHNHGAINGFRCNFCKGTGFQSPTSQFVCSFCKGTGVNNAY